MSSMSRGRKLPNEQNRRSGGKSRTKKATKHAKKAKRVRSSTKDYSESKQPAAGTSGKIPIVRGGSAGRYSEDGKSVNWADKPNGGTKKMKKTMVRKKKH
jgi:hypothetical protein